MIAVIYLQKCKEAQKAGKWTSKALPVVHVRHQVAPETHSNEESDKAEEAAGWKGVANLAKWVEIFASIVNPTIYLIFTLVYFTLAIMSM